MKIFIGLVGRYLNYIQQTYWLVLHVAVSTRPSRLSSGPSRPSLTEHHRPCPGGLSCVVWDDVSLGSFPDIPDIAACRPVAARPPHCLLARPPACVGSSCDTPGPTSYGKTPSTWHTRSGPGGRTLLVWGAAKTPVVLRLEMGALWHPAGTGRGATGTSE